MAKQICTKCGFEGRGKRKGGGGLFRLFGFLFMLPIHSLWKLFGSGGGKLCPHCELPSMVKITSDAGRLAQHMMDLELGLVQPKKPVEKKPVEGFGNTRPERVRETKKTANPEEW